MDRIESLWQQKLSDAVKDGLKVLRRSRVLCAHNVVTDFIEFIKPEIIQQLVAREDGKRILELSRRVSSLITVKDFLAALIDCLRSGKAAHYVTESEELIKWLGEQFETPDARNIGGQAGIVANQLCALGGKVILVTPMLSKLQAKLLHKKILVPCIEKAGLFFKSPLKAAKESDPTKINWIFEFKQGQQIRVADESIVAPRSNRLIVASAPRVDYVFKREVEKWLPEIGKRCDVAFISGYHYMPPENFEECLNWERRALRALKRGNPTLTLHYEFVPFMHKELEAKILTHITQAFDSFGCNEIECREIARSLGFLEEASALERRECAETLYYTGLKILSKLRLKRLHIHAWGYFVLLLKKPYRSPESACRAALFASAIANTKAMTGKEVKLHEMIKYADKLPIASSGFNQLRSFSSAVGPKIEGFDYDAFLRTGIAEQRSHFAIVVPTQLAPRPALTVGLGDIISAFTLIAEAAFERRSA